MILMEHYLQQLRPFYDSDLIKIITGIRRCGKSVIMQQVRHCIRRQRHFRLPETFSIMAKMDRVNHSCCRKYRICELQAWQSERGLSNSSGKVVRPSSCSRSQRASRFWVRSSSPNLEQASR